MKRFLLALSFALAGLAAISCATSGNESIASYSKEIRIDDPVTVRLFDSFSMQDNDQTLAAARKAVTITPKVDFDVQVVDPQTLCIIPTQPLEYNTTYKVTADVGKIAGVSGGKQTFEVKTLAPILRFDYSKLTGYPDIDDRYQPLSEGTLEGNLISYEIPAVTRKMDLRCTVTDAYGNSDEQYYYVSVKNRWKAYPKGATVGNTYINCLAAPEESLTLKVNIKADADADISQLQYEWYTLTDDDEAEIRNSLEADEGHPDRYTIPSVTQRTRVYCDVSDQFGNSESVDFYIKIDSGLEAFGSSTPEGEYHDDGIRKYLDVYVPYGGNVTLKANATTSNGNEEVSYKWYDQDQYDYLDESGSELTLTNVTDKQIYRCTVEDAYDHAEYVQ